MKIIKPWITTEIKYLQEHYSSQSAQATCDHLDRSFNSVRRKADHLGLRVGGFNCEYINGELQQILARLAA